MQATSLRCRSRLISSTRLTLSENLRVCPHHPRSGLHGRIGRASHALSGTCFILIGFFCEGRHVLYFYVKAIQPFFLFSRTIVASLTLPLCHPIVYINSNSPRVQFLAEISYFSIDSSTTAILCTNNPHLWISVFPFFCIVSICGCKKKQSVWIQGCTVQDVIKKLWYWICNTVWTVGRSRVSSDTARFQTMMPSFYVSLEVPTSTCHSPTWERFHNSSGMATFKVCLSVSALSDEKFKLPSAG